MMSSLLGRDFLSAADLERKEVEKLFALTEALKKREATEVLKNCLREKSVAIIFQKPSLRTRVTFELAVRQLGGHPVVLHQAEIGLGQREATKDIAKNLEQWVDGIVARVFEHQILVELADHANVPVINALSDLEHPCQALADLFTLREAWGEVSGRHVVFVGDGFNMAHSLLLLCAIFGTHITVATPKGYEPKESVVKKAKELAKESGAKVDVTNDHFEAVKGADAIYTDVWVSMGQEEEMQRRRRDFAPYQVNAALLSHAQSHALVMHCLPAHRGEEITDDVLDSPRCIALKQAENRLHVQKSLLAFLVGGAPCVGGSSFSSQNSGQDAQAKLEK